MERILHQLAVNLGMPAFTADMSGKYHIRIDGESIFIYKSGYYVVVASFLNWYYQQGNAHMCELLTSLLCQVTSWSRQYPQGLALNQQGQLLLEARQLLIGLDVVRLERILAAQVGILEQIKRQLPVVDKSHEWNRMIWRP